MNSLRIALYQKDESLSPMQELDSFCELLLLEFLPCEFVGYYDAPSFGRKSNPMILPRDSR